MSSPAQQPKKVLVRLVSTYDTTPLWSTVNLQLNKRMSSMNGDPTPRCKTGKHKKYNVKGGCNNKKSISATITREVKEAFAAQPKSSCRQQNSEPDDQATTNAEKYITSVVHVTVAKMQADGEKTEPSKPKVTLQSIIKQAKNVQA